MCCMVILYVSYATFINMYLFAKVTVEHHEYESFMVHNSITRTQQVLYLYRVVGNSPSAATQQSRQLTKSSTFPPSVVITIEGLKTVSKAHIAVCNAIKQTGGVPHRNFHLCGVTEKNRQYLADEGLLDGIDEQNLHASIASLLQSLSDSSSQRQGEHSRLRFPSEMAPFAPFVPNDTLDPPLS